MSGLQAAASEAEPHLRLVSYNIQVGMRTRHYGDYVGQSWRHLLPGRGMRATLDRIAEVVSAYDFVAIQEADAGSLRTQGLDQLGYLAQRAGFPHYGVSVTRDIRPLARHCLGYLSRLPPTRVDDYALPSRIPGRRAMNVQLGSAAGNLLIVLTHLSLSAAARRRQLDFISARLPDDRPLLLLGDLNCEPEELGHHPGLLRCGLHVAYDTPATFPSWRPYRRLDQMLFSPHLRLLRLEALPQAASDHRPLAAEIAVGCCNDQAVPR